MIIDYKMYLVEISGREGGVDIVFCVCYDIK